MENKGKTLFFGTLIGAFTGLVAAMLLSRRAESNENSNAITITTGDGIKIGALVFGLLRAIASLGDDT
jgi:hypothetical protein